MLFVTAADIPVPVEPLTPRAAAHMAAYASVLSAAETTALAELSANSIGRSVTVAGERRPADALRSSEALLDDGTAVIGLQVASTAPRSLRESLATRFLLVNGTVRDHEGELQVLVEHAGDLRTIAREWHSRR